ncbi:Rne/Rng family ribonuclease, partial [bacterium]|nr:Rne/Rng family ribonuclease [bacterium]
MLQEVFISIDEREARAVLYEDGCLMETLIDCEDSKVGRIFKGRVQNVIDGMNAAFVDIGLERNGFLCADDASAHLRDLDLPPAVTARRRIADIAKTGQDTVVQIAKDVVGQKGVRLTTNISLSGRFFVLLPTIPACHVGVSRKISAEDERERLRNIAHSIVSGRCGTIVRTAANNCSEEDLRGEWELLWNCWESIKSDAKVMPVPSCLYKGSSFVDKVVRDMLPAACDRIVIDNREEYQHLRQLLASVAPELEDKVTLYSAPEPLFSSLSIDDAIDKALHRKIHLKSGGNLIIEHTEALWVIDVNTAQNVKQNAILATNLEAAAEVCRQMRLRNMGGIIIVDFINMDDAQEQEALLSHLADQLKRDRVRTKLMGMTELGLVQITRKREGKDLGRILDEACPRCHGQGRVLSARETALKARRELLRCHSELPAEVYAVHLSPRAAWRFVGKGGGMAAELAQRLGRPVRVAVERCFAPGQFLVRRCSMSEPFSCP